MIEILALDTLTGEVGERILNPETNDYLVLPTGRRYLDGITTYGNGTVVLTLKLAPAEAGESDDAPG